MTWPSFRGADHYVLQAKIFSEGRLHADSPLYPQFFDVWGMVNNGKFYAWAPPGWPLLLAPGLLLQVPWLVNPLLGALTLMVVYHLGKLVYNATVGFLAVFFMLLSPFFLLHAASYFAHASGLLFITLFVFCYARGVKRKTSGDFIWAGLCGSMSLLIRPFDQAAVFCPLGAYLLCLALRGDVAVRQVVGFGLAHGVGVLLLAGYNVLQTGHPLTMGYHVGYGQPLFDLSFPGRHFIPEYLLHLLVWAFPLMPPIALLFSVWPGRTWAKSPWAPRWDTLFLLVVLSNVLWYAFIPFHYWAGYGPRYYHASFFALALIGARGAVALFERLKRRWPAGEAIGLAAVALGICAALSLGAEVIITFDADGQHDPDDAIRLLAPIDVGEAEVVIGSRMLDPQGMPYRRRVANWLANVITYLLFGGWTTDSQSGLRAFSSRAAARL